MNPQSTKEHPTAFQRSVCWGALTGLSLVALAAIACGVVYGMYSAFIALKIVLLPFVIAGVLAYLLHPCVVWLQRRLQARFGRGDKGKKKGDRQDYRRSAVGAVMIATGLVLVGLLMSIIPPLVQQTGQLIAKREAILDNTVAATRDFLSENETAQFVVNLAYDNTPFDEGEAAAREAAPEQDYTAKALAVLSYYADSLTDVGKRWLYAGTRGIYDSLGYLFGLVMIPVALYYFLLNSADITRKWHEVIPLPPGHFRDEVVSTLREINNYIIAFVRGQMLVSLIDGLLLGTALTILGLPYAIPIAAAAALLGIIPYLGTILTCIPALCIAWFYWHDAHYVLGVLAIFAAVSQLDGWVLQPKLVGKLVGMHDLTIMFSVLFWGSVLGGVVGALLAVPLTASIKVLLVRYVGSTFGQQRRAKHKLPPRPKHS